MHWSEKVITLAWWATLCWILWADGADRKQEQREREAEQDSDEQGLWPAAME
jgi:hypothetical protein